MYKQKTLPSITPKLSIYFNDKFE